MVWSRHAIAEAQRVGKRDSVYIDHHPCTHSQTGLHINVVCIYIYPSSSSELSAYLRVHLYRERYIDMYGVLSFLLVLPVRMCVCVCVSIGFAD